MLRRRNGLAMLVATALAAAFAPPSAAQQTINLTIGSSHPEVVPWVAALKNYVVPEIKKRAEASGKYKVNFREAYNGVLYKANATLTSVSEGIADMGWVFSNLEGARQPLIQVSTYTPGVTDNYRLMSAVHNELMDSVPQFKAEWDKHGLVHLGAMSIDPLHLFTKFPVRSVDDLKGKKISAAGTIGAWLGAMGATPVDGALPTFYNDIKTGVSEGGMTVVTGALGIKLHETVNYITLVNMGCFYAGALAMNRDSFNKLPPELQKIVRDVGREYSEKVSEGTDRAYGIGLKVFAEQGAKQNPPLQIVEFPPAEREKLFKSMKNLALEWAKANDAKGLPASAILKQYMDTMRGRGAKPVRDWDRG